MPDPTADRLRLQRHGLAWLRPAAWERMARAQASGRIAGSAAGPDDGAGAVTEAADVLACLRDWAAHDRPVVVARQDPAAAGGIAVGLPAPARWGRRRIALRVAAGDIARQGAFPPPEAVAPLLPAGARESWLRLSAALRALGVAAGVYGSYGWQALTGLDYLHAGSDIDLRLPVRDAGQADRVADRLAAAPDEEAPRIDGELALFGGASVAWREWRRWRAGGMAGAVLVKRLDGVAMERGGGWLLERTGTEACAGAAAEAGPACGLAAPARGDAAVDAGAGA